MKTAWIILLAIEPAFCGCVQVSGEEIHASDLARAVESFAAADPASILGLAPEPGVRRIFTLRDLESAAQRAGVGASDLPEGGVCFERVLRQVTEQELHAAMSLAFPDKAVQISIIDHSRNGVPPGRLVFQLSGLNSPPLSQSDAPVLWRGRALYTETRSMEIWARVRLTTMTTCLLAASDIPPGKPIERDQVRIAELPRFPLLRSGGGGNIESIVGRVARRPIRAGQEIAVAVLEEPREIRPGDTVRVLAVSGNARVTLDAVATSGGRKGDTILLKNPSTNSSFRAVIEGRDRAVVRAGRGDGS
jgi:flagella basal body P-ring formation protein FlgA